jgi:hypothetical protein
MAYEMGKEIFAHVKPDATADEQTILNVYGAMINMYGKCGLWEEAEVRTFFSTSFTFFNYTLLSQMMKNSSVSLFHPYFECVLILLITRARSIDAIVTRGHH